MIDIKTISRPHNITIDTKYCLGYVNDLDDMPIVYEVHYKCGIPHFMYCGMPYPIPIKSLYMLYNNVIFLTESEMFLEEI